jgi:hypothetical protein
MWDDALWAKFDSGYASPLRRYCFLVLHVGLHEADSIDLVGALWVVQHVSSLFRFYFGCRFSQCILPNQADIRVTVPKVGQNMQELHVVEHTLKLSFDVLPCSVLSCRVLCSHFASLYAELHWKYNVKSEKSSVSSLRLKILWHACCRQYSICWQTLLWQRINTQQ